MLLLLLEHLWMITIFLIIFSGLPDEYDSFVDLVKFHLAEKTVDDLQGFLLSKEMDISRTKQNQGFSNEPLQAYN